MRASIRMAALSHAGVLFVMTHDSIGLGEDGPTHQPVEHLASFRAMPNILMLRPGDGNETAGAYKARQSLCFISCRLICGVVGGPPRWCFLQDVWWLSAGLITADLFGSQFSWAMVSGSPGHPQGFSRGTCPSRRSSQLRRSRWRTRWA